VRGCLPFDVIAGLAQSGGVDEDDRNACTLAALDGIPGRSSTGGTMARS
jgi:hypothetical protein